MEPETKESVLPVFTIEKSENEVLVQNLPEIKNNENENISVSNQITEINEKNNNNKPSSEVTITADIEIKSVTSEYNDAMEEVKPITDEDEEKLIKNLTEIEVNDKNKMEETLISNTNTTEIVNYEIKCEESENIPNLEIERTEQSIIRNERNEQPIIEQNSEILPEIKNGKSEKNDETNLNLEVTNKSESVIVKEQEKSVSIEESTPIDDNVPMNIQTESVIITTESQLQETSTPILSESESESKNIESLKNSVLKPINTELELINDEPSKINPVVTESSSNPVESTTVMKNETPIETPSVIQESASTDVKDVLEDLQANLGITDMQPDESKNKENAIQIDQNVVFFETTNETINMESTNEEEVKEPVPEVAELPKENGHLEDEEINKSVNEVKNQKSEIESDSTFNAIDAVVKNENIPVAIPTPRTPKKKSKASTPNSKNIMNDVHASQKRRKKDPAAPKAPLNGYLVYFNDERADMRMKNPNMGFGELTKIIALKWKDLPMNEKQRFINEADHDKERYVKEMAEYKKSDSYKNYVKETSQAKLARNDEILNNSLQNDAMNSMSTPNSFSIANETNIAGFDIPIFTEEFIEHSKSRENEMRLVRKEITELEQQNSVLHKHIEIMKQSSVKLDNDIERYQNTNNQIKQKMDAFRQTMINCNIQIPNTLEYPTPNNIDDYIMRLYSIVANSKNSTNQNDAEFANHVKSVLSKINFNTLFE